MSKFVVGDSTEIKKEAHKNAEYASKIELEKESASVVISTLAHHVKGSKKGICFGKWKEDSDASSLVGKLIKLRKAPLKEERNEEFLTCLVKNFNGEKGHYIQSCELEKLMAWIDLTKLNPDSIRWHGAENLIEPESPESICKQLLEFVKDCSSLEEVLSVLAVYDLTREEAVYTWDMKKLMDDMKKLELMEEEENLRKRQATVQMNKTLLEARIKKKKEERMRKKKK